MISLNRRAYSHGTVIALHSRVATRVLLVEDDTHNLEALTIYLRLTGFQAEQARDGLEALGKLAHETFDVVVSDLRMPGLDGIELAKRMLHTSRHVPIVLMTGDPDVPTSDAINEAGVLGLLTKPFMPEELVKIIELAVGDP